MFGTKFYKSDFISHEDEMETYEEREAEKKRLDTLQKSYAELAVWCNGNHAIIEDKGEYYEAVALPEKTLDELKEQAVNQLWRNYKAHQQKYVDAEDLTLATLCAAKGSEKGSVVQMWVMSLWAQYYTVRDAISAAGTEEELEAIDLGAEWYGEPPYTIRELNEEAAAFLANSGEESTTEENKEL